MKKQIAFLLLSLSLYGDSLLKINIDDGTQTEFLKVDRCYYKDSYKNSRNCYKQTGNLFIKSKDPLSSEFLKKYNLVFLKEINRQTTTSLYRSLNTEKEIIKVVNKINNENKQLSATVEWIKPRRVF